MSRNILIIGGVALGPKAASRCKRLDPSARITLIDENEFISYGGCGIPYYMSGEINNIDDLRSTTYHAIRNPEFFRVMRGITVRTHTRALSIDTEAKNVLVCDLKSGKEETLAYDTLVLATGASPRIPAVEGHDLKNVHVITKLETAQAIRQGCEAGTIQQAVIVGGGFIGLESAVALADMWGVECSLVEWMPQLLPGVLSANLARMAEHDFASHKVRVLKGEKVLRLEGDADGRVARVVTDQRILEAQLVIFATGFVPNGQLAKKAGLDVTPFGGIVVDEHMRTTDPHIYAGGDCVALRSLITDRFTYLPMGSIANRQGRVIGTNLAGGDARFKGVVGSWAIKLFGLSFCGVGLTVEQAKAEGFDAMNIAVEQWDRAHFYPEKSMMSLELVVERGTRRVLGAQGACAAGDSLKARMDAIAVALQMGKPTVDDIAQLEVAYSPPFASAMDIVNVVGNVADNALEDRLKPLAASEFMQLWRGRAENNVFFMDVRPGIAGKSIQQDFPEWQGIPLEELKAKLDTIPRDRPIALTCNTGLRAYEALLLLAREGFTDVSHSMGGVQAVHKMGLDPKNP